MAESKKGFSIPFIIAIGGYALAFLELLTLIFGGFRSKSGAWLIVRPEISGTLCAVFFIIGTIFLVITIVRFISTTNAKEAKRRWRGRPDQSIR